MTYASQTASRVNSPSYYITIEGIATEEYSTHPVKSAGLTKIKCLQIPQGTSQSLTPLQLRATVGEVRLRVVDSQSKITNLLSTEKTSPLVPSIVNRTVTLKGGYRDEPESEFQSLFVGEIRNVELVEPLTYEITVAAKTRKLDDMLMAGIAPKKSKMAATIRSTTTLNVQSVSGWNNYGFPYTAIIYRRDGSQYEKVTITALNSTANTFTITAPTQFAWGQAGDVITNAPFLRGNMISIFYSLMTNSFSRNYFETAYPLVDFANAPTGVTFAASDIDTALLDLARDRGLAEFDLDFIFEREVKARAFLEQQIYPLGLYQTYSGSGKLGVRAFVPPGFESSSLPKVYKEHMIEFPKWKRRILEHQNRVVITGDRDITSDLPDVTLVTYQDTTDQTNSKETVEFNIASEGLRSSLQGASVAQEIAARILRRWKIPPIEIKVPVAFTKRGLQAGDMVQVSHPALPDNTTGTRGLVDRTMEVVEVSVQYARGQVELTLLDSAYGSRWSWIGPASMAVYGSASATEKKYCYLGDAANKVNSGTEAGYVVF